jgi:hypothetical protein
MFDYYAFPADAPGMADRPHGSPYARIQHVESALVKAIDDKRFVPNLILHEIEAWVFADCRARQRDKRLQRETTPPERLS